MYTYRREFAMLNPEKVRVVLHYVRSTTDALQRVCVRLAQALDNPRYLSDVYDNFTLANEDFMLAVREFDSFAKLVEDERQVNA